MITNVVMRKKVLIVDDSEFVRSYHSYILEQAQFDVVTAIDGSEGLEKLYACEFDLVLSDINMSNMDGYDFIRRVRTDARYDSLPIIIVSTESESREKSRGFEAGATLYQVKPCTPEMMVENIRMVLRPD